MAHNGEGKTGRLFVISAPSGAGKSTLCRRLKAACPELKYSVSTTTRAPRPGETDGVEYFFISKEAFTDQINENAFVEWAEVHGHFYGTSARFLETAIADGISLLLDIDVQGMRQLIGRFAHAVTIFIAPPSMDVLESRLRSRGTDSEAVIQTRLQNAVDELAAMHEFQHIIMNDDLETAAAELIALVKDCLRQPSEEAPPF